MKAVVLPNGQEIWALNSHEGAVLYHEIYDMQSYSKHGIKIADGDCVFDVGANIGLYTLFLAQSCRTLRVFAFEPIPDIFAVLQRNIQTHAANLDVKLFNNALSDKRGTAQFEFDRALSLTATMRPDEVKGSIRKNVRLSEWMTAGVLDLQRIRRLSDTQAAFILKVLSTPILKQFAAAMLLVLLMLAGVRKKLFLQRVECTLTTISDILREQGLDTIHLLKIDVEGSERDVIDGIDSQDWTKIQQLVVEVHDVNGRVEALREILERHGYQTVIDQEEWALHKLLGIFTLYAVRD